MYKLFLRLDFPICDLPPILNLPFVTTMLNWYELISGSSDMVWIVF